MNRYGFEGKTIVVTGGAGGIGVECGKLLAAGGAHVHLVDVRADALDAAAAELVDDIDQFIIDNGRLPIDLIEVFGEVPVDDLLSFFNVLIDMALPEINEMILSEGLVLPTIEGISFGNAELGFDPDYLEVGVTPIYNWVHLRQVMKRPRPGKAAKKLVIT